MCRDILLLHRLQKVQGWFDLLLGISSLHCGADYGHVLSLCGHVVSIGDHAHVDICRHTVGSHKMFLWVTAMSYRCSAPVRPLPLAPTMLPVDLVLGDDDLAGVGIAGILNGVVHDADDTDHLTHLAHFVHNVAWVTNQLLTASDLG